jgi:hypothetical protein
MLHISSPVLHAAINAKEMLHNSVPHSDKPLTRASRQLIVHYSKSAAPGRR